MAHFAKLGTGSIVERIEDVSNDVATTEQAGIEFLKSLYGNDTVWKQTSYNGNIRKNYAGIGFKYDESRDAFIPPQPYPSWTLNETTCRWEAPVPYPTDGELYVWNETNKTWDLG